MPTAYSRVTVVNGTRKVDLALPSALPLSDVVPQVLRFCSPEERPDQPDAWTLGPLGGPDISLARSLSDAGVLDGDVLELRSAAGPSQPAYVEDVRDIIEDVVDEAGGRWTSRTSAGFVLTLAGVAMAAAAALPFTRRPDELGALVSAMGLAGLAVNLGAFGAMRAHPAAAQLQFAVGGLWGGIAGGLVGASLDWPGPVTVAVAAAVAFVVSVAARIASPLATPHLAALGVVAVVAGIAAGADQAWDRLTPERVAGVLAVLAVGMFPRMSIALGGLATADYRVRKAALITQRDLAERIRRSGNLLFGAILGASAVGALAGVGLAYADSTWDRLLGLSVGAGLLLRSRISSRVRYMAPLRVAGTIGLAAHVVRLGSSQDLRPWFAALVGAAAVVLVAVSAVPLSQISRARIKRALNWAEHVVVVAMIALAAAALGLYDMVADLMS